MSQTLMALTVKFFQELIHFFPQLLVIDESELILKILTLIDPTLEGSLIIIVMFSGYENFASQLDIEDSTEKLDWLGSHDYGFFENESGFFHSGNFIDSFAEDFYEHTIN